MSDFGSDVGNSGLNLMSKLLTALLDVLKKIFEMWEKKNSAKYKKEKLEFKEYKKELRDKKEIEKINGKVGYVNHKKLIKAGVPLQAIGVTLSETDFKRFAERCKREGIVVSATEDAREKALNGRKFMCVEVKASDLERVKSLFDLMLDEERIVKLKAEISNLDEKNKELVAEKEALLAKDENEWSDADEARLSEINSEIKTNAGIIEGLSNDISNIRYGYCDKMNEEQAYGICEKAINGETNHGVTFDEAVNRWTSKEIDKDICCYIVDGKNPNNYIVANATNDTFRGETYIKSTYDVYKNNEKVYTTDDRRFEGRTNSYWCDEKTAMRQKGDIGNTVYKFYSLEEFEAYKENYKAQNERELDGLRVGETGRDYDAIVKQLEQKIDECGAVYKNGELTDKETGKPLELREDMNSVEKAAVAEATTAARQIDNYKQIERLETDLAIAKTAVITTEGTKDFNKAKADYDELQSQYDAAIETEKNLVEERKNINTVQAEQETKPVREQIKEQGTEKTDDRREEQIDEVDEKHLTMAEWKAEIEQAKATEGKTKGNDFADREVNKTKTVPQSRDDR